MFLNKFALFCILTSAFPALLAQSATQSIDGTWWMSFGPGATKRPLILNLADSGTFTLVDSTDGGGHVPTGAKMSVIQGSWTRSGPNSAQALGLRFVYNSLGKTHSVERVRFSISFERGFDQMQGMLQLEEMFCSESPAPPLPFPVPVCPNPVTAPTQVQRGPAPFTAVRVPINAPLN